MQGDWGFFMKLFFRFLCSGIAVCCIFGGVLSACAHKPEVSALSWLTGCWQSESMAPGSGEQWVLQGDGVLYGVSRFVKNGKIGVGEAMQIRAQKDGKLAFFAQPAGQQPAVFPLLRMTESEAVFENLQHDFPQRIVYRLEDSENLAARIEGLRKGELRTITFPMHRVRCAAQ